MRRMIPWCLLAMALAAPASQAGTKCPLDVAECLSRYERMRVRPWLGVKTDQSDTTRGIVITEVEPESPAARGGIRPGDVLQSIDGQKPREWFMTKAGWKPKDRGKFRVLRDGAPVALEVPLEALPEERFARMLGVHMVEGHLASASPPEKP